MSKTNDTKRQKVEKPIKSETIQFVRDLIERYPLESNASEIMKLKEMTDFMSSHFKTNSTEKVAMPHIVEACIQGLDDDGVRLYCKSAKSTAEKTEPDTTEENTTSFAISDDLFETMSGLLDIAKEKQTDKMKKVVSMLIHPNSLSRATDDIITDIKDVADNKDSDGIKNIIKLVELLKANIDDIADAFKTGNTFVIIATISILIASHEDYDILSDDNKNATPEENKNKLLMAISRKPKSTTPMHTTKPYNNRDKIIDDVLLNKSSKHTTTNHSSITTSNNTSTESNDTDNTSSTHIRAVDLFGVGRPVPTIDQIW